MLKLYKTLAQAQEAAAEGELDKPGWNHEIIYLDDMQRYALSVSFDEPFFAERDPLNLKASTP
ncbi:MAG: hypothetical protein V3T77_11285 [Planctomycetota bacterium]